MRRLEVPITPWQRRVLRQLRDRSGVARVVKRAICLLLSAAGESGRRIAQVTGLSRDGITAIRRRWQRRGLAALHDQPRQGRPRRVSVAYRRQLRQALRRGPLAFGYAFTVWSLARLARHLQKTTGLHVSADYLRSLAHQEGFGMGRPKRTLKGKRDEAEFRRAQQRLNQLKKGR